MSQNTRVTSHPLDLNDPEEDDNYSNTTISASFKKTDTKINFTLEGLMRRRPEKPIAPKRPDPPKQLFKVEEKQLNFYIEIDQVRWYYRGDKVSTTGPNTPSAVSQTSLPNVQSSSNLIATDQSINCMNENDINNNNNNNANMSSINLNPKKWYKFSKIDSYNLEIEYRDMMSKKMHNLYSEVNLVQVLNDLYEVNLETKKCYPIYWKSPKTMSVMRCIWYTDNGEPFDERIGEQIEKKHLELFKDQLGNDVENSINSELQVCTTSSSPTENNEDIGVKSSKNDLVKSIEIIDSIKLNEHVVNWYSKDDVYWENCKLNVRNLLSKISNLNKKYSGIKIRRGLKEKHKESDSEEKLPEITHLVFVIHGIAQKLYENSVIKNCEELRKECEKKKKDFFENNKNERFIFLPVDWRSSLILDDGIVESITPKSIQTIRDKLNSSALDIMYYTSPLYRTEIMTSLTNEMNRLYNLFCEKNPSFKKNHNKVSLIAHSLGTVIVYDIIIANTSINQMTNNYGEDSSQEKLVLDHLSHNDATLLNQYLDIKQKLEEIEKKMINTNSRTSLLAFKPENFFLLGSPLAVFLALRGVRPAGLGSQDHILPKRICKKLFNIFHPSDPIAYRLEPLVLKHYATKSPVEIIKSSDTGFSKLSYKELNGKRNPISSDLKSALTKIPGGKKKEKNDPKSAELNQLKDDTKSTNSFSDSIDQVELEDALDYQLSESNFELMAALKAHTCYWKSSDTALFIVQHLFTNDNGSSCG